MTQSLSEITNDLLTDTRPGIDGCSNADRAVYICEVLDMGQINLNLAYDFSSALRTPHLPIAMASRDLALLQLDYLRRLADNDLIDDEQYEMKSAVIMVDAQRLNWHISHLREGLPTPPFSYTGSFRD